MFPILKISEHFNSIKPLKKYALSIYKLNKAYLGALGKFNNILDISWHNSI